VVLTAVNKNVFSFEICHSLLRHNFTNVSEESVASVLIVGQLILLLVSCSLLVWRFDPDGGKSMFLRNMSGLYGTTFQMTINDGVRMNNELGGMWKKPNF
jgi:hypothetical protein